MAFSCVFPDIYCWIQNLPPITEWTKNSSSLCICSSSSSSQPSLNLSIAKNNQSSSTLSFSIVADFNLSVSLWTSKSFKPISSKSTKFIDEENMSNLLVNFIQDVLHYGSNTNNSFLKFPKLDTISHFKDTFNFAFLTLSFLVCIYESPVDLRTECLNTLKNALTNCQSRQASRLLLKLLGSNLEEQWMRSLNLAITNWTIELQGTHRTLKTPSPLFSYAISTVGLWKVHLYCPVIAMDVENSSHPLADERLQFSLTYHQLEGVVQFNHKVVIQERWINVMVNTDNVRCDVIRLVNETLANELGVGVSEKHFPSRISLQLTPTLQTNIISLSVSKSSENPSREIGFEKSIEAGFDATNNIGLKISAGETMTMSLKPWKFEESVDGYSANLNWFLHDSMDGREVFSSKPRSFH